MELADAVVISDILALLRRAGANISATPGETASLLALAQGVADNDDLWRGLPREIAGMSAARLRSDLRATLAA